MYLAKTHSLFSTLQIYYTNRARHKKYAIRIESKLDYKSVICLESV